VFVLHGMTYASARFVFPVDGFFGSWLPESRGGEGGMRMGVEAFVQKLDRAGMPPRASGHPMKDGTKLAADT